MQICCPVCETQIDCETVQLSGPSLICPNCDTLVDLQGMVEGTAAVEISTSFADGFLDDDAGTVAFTTNVLEDGSLIGKFQILKEIGKGGFGCVYKAYDQQLERIVALKIPRRESNSHLDAGAFLREAQMAASVRDPNIVAVHEIGKDGDHSYICSEFIDGCTLKTWYRDEERTIEELCRMIVWIAKSLHKAHLTGLVHRDLKPANILIDQENTPFITDFGLARKFVSGSDRPDARKIEIVGTPAYMSPEQAVGDVSKINAQTDVYSLGVMLYELTAKQRPFVGEVASIIQDILYHEPPRPSTSNAAIPKALEAIILKAMSKEQADRYPSALEFAEDLERFINGEPTTALPLTRSEFFAYQVKRHSWLIAIVAFLLVAVGMTYWISQTFFKEDPQVVEKEVAAKIPTVEVLIESEPGRANVAIVPIDPKTRKPLRKKIVQPEGLTPLKVDLPAGDYLVEAYLPNLGVQEVRRAVNEKQVKAAKPISFRPIKILPLPKNLALVPAGEIDIAYEASNRNQVRMEIGSFYIQTTEVTCAQFQTVMGSLPQNFGVWFSSPVDPDLPVSRFTFKEALDYCERSGLRLMEYEEYCLVATNGGTTGVPWGDVTQREQVKDWWQIAPVKSYVIDQTQPPQTSQPVFGLFSNVPELTATTVVLDVLVQSGITGQENSVAVVGRPLSMMGKLPTEPDLPLQARHFGSKYIESFFQLDYPVGLRCVRSSEPRFLNLDKIK